MKADSQEFRQEVVAAFDGRDLASAVQVIVNLARQCEERSYIEGQDIARKLLRLQLGLATEEDRKWADQ